MSSSGVESASHAPVYNIDNSDMTTINSLITTAISTLASNASNALATTKPTTSLYSTRKRYIISGTLMLLGVLGNLLALIILARKKTTKNNKYTLMLRCLTTNNFIGLMGMLTTLLLTVYVPKDVMKRYMQWKCVGMVLWRFFGLSSGCIATVMAIERWMALARPFIYHKHITYELVRRTIKSLVLIATIITFLPIFGFGAYMDDSDPNNLKCLRYRDASGFWNKAYAVLFMLFGSLLCLVIVACNLFVARVLCFIGRTRSTTRHMHYDMVYREKGSGSGGNRTPTAAVTVDGESNSGTSLYQHRQSISSSSTMPSTTSPDEIKFAKLMAFLSLSFVVCWMPQMIAIPMAIIPNCVPPSHKFFLFADALMALHFTSDPYVYVLSRTKNSFFLGCIKRWSGGLRRAHSDHSRLRTTTVEQHTTDCGLN